MQKQVFLIPIMQPRIIKRIEKKVTLVFDSRKEQKKKKPHCVQTGKKLAKKYNFVCLHNLFVTHC